MSFPDDIDTMESDMGAIKGAPDSHEVDVRCLIIFPGATVAQEMTIKAVNLGVVEPVAFGGSSPFKVTINKSDTGVYTADISTGYIFDSDLTENDPFIIKEFGVSVSGGDWLCINQDIDSAGVSTYSVVTESAPLDLITVDTDKYYATNVKHLIAKVVSNTDGDGLGVNQYITTNLVRAVSTHSGAAYYRLLPR